MSSSQNSYLCKYKDIFGKPGHGAHKYRIFNFAIVDVILTVIAALLISKAFHQSFAAVLVVLLLLAIIMHHAFCVKTTLDKLIFDGEYHP